MNELTEVEVIVAHLESGAISIDDEGRVWRHGRFSSGVLVLYSDVRRTDSPDEAGYMSVKLTARPGKRISTSAHRIQWIKHHGAIPDGVEINHKDLNKANNRLDNLELMTRSENLYHARRLKNWSPDCPDHPKAKLTWEKVRYIRAELAAKRSTKAALARQFGVTAVSIHHIAVGVNWPLRRDPLAS